MALHLDTRDKSFLLLSNLCFVFFLQNADAQIQNLSFELKQAYRTGILSLMLSVLAKQEKDQLYKLAGKKNATRKDNYRVPAGK
eukprot:snap_masked-scaffold_2-processed-gene-21.14-mRNA-1 protein AED:1.00 eAED:1.00 QI:0/0/0/0/1/1/2/0/83